MSEISKNIVEQIKEGGIKPKPRWQFVLKNALLMTAVVAAIVLGGLVMSLVFMKVADLDWELVSVNGERGLPRIFEVLPLLWMLMLVLVLLLAVWSFEKTDSAYRVRPVWVVLGSVGMSLLLAGLLFLVRGPNLMEDFLRAHVPVYDQMERDRFARFHLPMMGILPGQVVSFGGDCNCDLTLEDVRDNVWDVNVVPGSQAQRALGRLKVGQAILMIGEGQTEGQFMAKEIRPKQALMIRVKNVVMPFGQPL